VQCFKLKLNYTSKSNFFQFYMYIIYHTFYVLKILYCRYKKVWMPSYFSCWS